MKKKLLLAVLVVLTLCSCQGKEIPEKDDNITQNQVSQNETIKIEKTDEKIDLEDMTILGETTINTEPTVSNVYLATSAKKDSDGYMMWDDSQRWVLVAEDETGSYNLFDSVTNAQVYIDVTNTNNTPVINLIRVSTVGMTVTQYRYEDGAFYEEDVITAHPDGNNIYSSIPAY